MAAPQQTPQWKMDRLGKATASRIFEIVDLTVTGKYKMSRQHLMNELATEIIEQKPTEKFTSEDMRNGTAGEPIARITYEFVTGNPVVETGFVNHPKIRRSGSSPDGLVAPDGFTEFKVPRETTHRTYLETKAVPPRYQCQIGWNFACMPDRAWCDFVSYCATMPDEKDQLLIIRVERNDKFISRLEAEVERFVEELELRVGELGGSLG